MADDTERNTTPGAKTCSAADQMPVRPGGTDRCLNVAETIYGRTDLCNLMIVATLWGGMVALLWPVGDFPLNDDWTYARSAQAVLDKGRFELLPYSQASALPQAYWGAFFGWLFGFSFTTLRFSTLILGLGGVLGTYSLLRELKVRPHAALLGTTTVAVNPLYFCLSNSFMTDVPFYFLVVASLLMWVRGLRRRESAWLVSGLLVSCLAILQRHLAIVLPLGFAAAWLWSRPVTARTAAIAVGPLLAGLLVHFLLDYWLQTQGRVPLVSTKYILVEAWHNFGPRLVQNGMTVLVYTGLFVLPSAIALLNASLPGESIRSRRQAWLSAGGLMTLSIAIFSILPTPMPLSQNVLTYFGFGPLTLRDTFLLHINNPAKPPTLAFAWLGVSALAAAGAALLLSRCWHAGAVAIRSVRARDRSAIGAVPILLVTTLSGYVALITVMTIGFFDRYVILCIPFALIVVSKTPTVGARWRRSVALRLLAWLLVAASAAFSVVAMRDYLAWNSARWTALASLTEGEGISPTRIDGGYEFNGWYLSKLGSLGQGSPGKSWWWVYDDEFVIAFGPLAGYKEITSYPFERWLQREHSRIVVLRRTRDAPEDEN